MRWKWPALSFASAFVCVVLFLSFNSNSVRSLSPLTSPVEQQQQQCKVSVPPIRCHVSDQNSYCVYERSLCILPDGSLYIVSGNASSPRGSFEVKNNGLQPSPFHFPFSIPLSLASSSLSGSVMDASHMLPYRSFFPNYQMGPSHPAGAVFLPSWSLVAAFDATNFNIYHFVNKMHSAFYARLYEIEKFSRMEPLTHDTQSFSWKKTLENLLGPNEGFARALLYRSDLTAWQKGFFSLAAGSQCHVHLMRSNNAQLPRPGNAVCLEKAIIPGAMLYLSDGLLSSTLFREMAATVASVRVAPQHRTCVTLFQRTDRRSMVNFEDVRKWTEKKVSSKGWRVEVKNWNENDSFEEQALHMAKTRVMVCTHGSVLNHMMFMEQGSVVIEINPHQFLYPLDQTIALHRGVYYLRHEATKENTKYASSDPFPTLTSKQCFDNMDCYMTRRDANLIVDLKEYDALLTQALSLVDF